MLTEADVAGDADLATLATTDGLGHRGGMRPCRDQPQRLPMLRQVTAMRRAGTPWSDCLDRHLVGVGGEGTDVCLVAGEDGAAGFSEGDGDGVDG